MRSLVRSCRTLALVAAVLVVAPASARAALSDSVVASDLQYAAQKLHDASAAVPVDRYPSQTPSPSGAWQTTTASGWTSGFFPGSLWLMYEATGDATWKSDAIARQAGLESQKTNTSTHDLGFMLFPSFGNAYRLTGDPAYRAVVLQAATSLATRYSSVVHATRSWNNGGSEPANWFKVIVDNMMNLNLFFWGAQNGGASDWTGMGLEHALTTMRNHVRPDGGSFHLVTFDSGTGAVISRTTVQGYRNDSTWARGEAWGVHGFTQAYAYTGDTRMLDTARRMADYFIANLPADSVPYYDFQAPATDRPRDSSAAAIAASGLLWLARVETDGCRAQRYLGAAESMLASLSGPPYLSQGTPGAASILLHGTAQHQNGNSDTGLAYGDYYFIEALLRWRAIQSGTTPLTSPLCLATPVLSVSPTSLSFSSTEGGASPAAQTISVANATGGPLPFTATPSASWLTVTPASGDAPATLDVAANTSGLAPGTYSGSVTIDGGSADGSPQVVPVTLTVAAKPTVLLGTSAIGRSVDGTTAGTAEAFRTTATASGTMRTLNVYLDSSSRATKLVAGVYSSSGSHPGRLLAQATLASPRSGAWNTLTVPSAAISSGGTYWIAVLAPSGTGTLQFRDVIGGGRSETSSQRSLAALPATWSVGRTYPDGPLSATGAP